ncbi:MAG: hypothetical protein U9R66_09045 [Thermodesulfobacteriota bacterium]|nr:hypothetical protein [Thermodesulfobacteriota bacterium]
MECERLDKLVRSWFLQVQAEAMAPARMVEFMEKHINECEVCLSDPDVQFEVKKITTIVLPESKIIKPAKKAKVKKVEPVKEEISKEETNEEENRDQDEAVKNPEETENKNE